MTLTRSECLWYSVLYGFVWFGVGFWLRKLVSIFTSEKRIDEK